MKQPTNQPTNQSIYLSIYLIYSLQIVDILFEITYPTVKEAFFLYFLSISCVLPFHVCLNAYAYLCANDRNDVLKLIIRIAQVSSFLSRQLTFFGVNGNSNAKAFALIAWKLFCHTPHFNR